MNCPHCQSTKEPLFSRELPMSYFCPDCWEDTGADPGLRTITSNPYVDCMVLINAMGGAGPPEIRRPDPVRAALEELMFLFPRPGDFGEVNDRVTAAHAAARKVLTDTQP